MSATKKSGRDQNRGRIRDRAKTETALYEAVGRLLARDGILAGLRLQEVAEEAGVNRGQIYQMFGDRRGLLRAALNRLVADHVRARGEMRQHPFAQRRLLMFEWVLENRRWPEIAALLALDGDTGWKLMPEFAATLENLDRDRREEGLPPDVDGPAAHIATSAVFLGYAIFREAYARDSGIALEELDVRVAEVYRRMLDGIVNPPRGL